MKPVFIDVSVCEFKFLVWETKPFKQITFQACMYISKGVNNGLVLWITNCITTMKIWRKYLLLAERGK